MKVFVWTRIDKVSDNCHREGGLVVFANDEEEARSLANAVSGVELKASELPSEVREVSCGMPTVYVFEDAGCC